MENLTSKYLINGPNNVVRLQNGEKILYIFGDYHWETNMQRECPINDNYDSIDIDKLLLKFIKQEKKREIDCFMESDYLDPPYYNNIYRHRYCDQVNKLFNSKIEIKNNQIITSKKYSNFRFHTFDIRYSIQLFNEIHNYRLSTSYIFSSINELKGYVNQHIQLLQFLDSAYIYINSNENKFINKIKNEYQNKEIKKKINIIFNDIILKNFNICIQNTKNIIEVINKNIDKLKNININKNLYNKIHIDIYEKIRDNKEFIGVIFVVLIDLYFIRRFLDKKNIKTALIYTGLSHMSDIIYILIKYFDFKLTNIYSCNKSFNLKKINKLSIKNLEYIKILDKNLCVNNENVEPTQCVNLFNFPINFT